MRIISGSNRGRRISAPNNLPVRPTTDMAKEAIFNILNNHFELDEVRVLDVFAGIGSISYEFASRGAVSVTSVDREYKCTKFIEKTVGEIGFSNVKVVKADAFKYLSYKHPKFDIIFADPPYDLENIEEIPGLVFDNDILDEEGWLVIEHSKALNFSEHPYYKETRRYGKVHFSIFGKSEY
jgi:16S rRNA (guanine(966)-N(2))-methyltransferase RsmD